MARPRGELRTALHEALKAGQGTTRELAARSGVGMTASMRTLDNMVTAGEVEKASAVRVPGVKRPVPVYALRESQASASGAADLQQALASWGAR
jgi:predicted ArsR family transcriptional regulator